MVQVRDSRSTPPRAVVALTGVEKVYPGRVGVRALYGVTVGFDQGSFTAVMGPSGSGKSTLLHCAAGLDRPTAGRVVLGGHDISAVSDDDLTRFRPHHVGVVF